MNQQLVRGYVSALLLAALVTLIRAAGKTTDQFTILLMLFFCLFLTKAYFNDLRPPTTFFQGSLRAQRFLLWSVVWLAWVWAPQTLSGVDLTQREFREFISILLGVSAVLIVLGRVCGVTDRWKTMIAANGFYIGALLGPELASWNPTGLYMIFLNGVLLLDIIVTPGVSEVLQDDQPEGETGAA